jgi:hypothetical protein
VRIEREVRREVKKRSKEEKRSDEEKRSTLLCCVYEQAQNG